MSSGDVLSEFRVHIREWLDLNFPLSLAYKNPAAYLNAAQGEPDDPDFLLWRKTMAETGFGVPAWPRQYGGADLDSGRIAILAEEMSRIGAFNPIGGNGVMMLGPTILEYGTFEQKAEHLPPIARGEVRWCQGFSEPGAGSDLASLQMRCEDRGDHWLVNGQKIWTSFAHHSDWCFCLVRTDRARKHDGISFLLIDMRTPGIEARPLKLINGVSHFCETFFTDVRVPKENILGPVNGGWTIAKRLLQHERGGLSAGRATTQSLADLARRYVGTDASGRIANGDLRGRLLERVMFSHAFALTVKRRRAEADAGQDPGTPMSVLKNLGARVSQERAEMIVEILGNNSLGWDGAEYEEAELGGTRDWLHSKCYSIYGGSHEIQNNITARRVLDLPVDR